MRSRALILLLLVAAALVARPLFHGSSHSAPRGHGFDARVVRDVDGDTLVASSGGRTFYVRLLGIDTPETHRPGTPVECGGRDASANMGRLAPAGQRILLEPDT